MKTETTERDLITEIEELLAKATPGPWRAVAYVGREPRHVTAGQFTEQSPIASPDNPNGLVAYADQPPNAELIAAAPELLRRLVEEVKRLRAHVADLNHDFDAAMKEVDDAEERARRRTEGHWR